MEETIMKKLMRSTMTFVLAIALVVTSLAFMPAKAKAATAITSMDYYDNGGNGPTQSKTGVAPVSFGTVMPKINGAALTKDSFAQYENDLELQVSMADTTGGEYKDINKVDYFKFNDTWGWEWQQWTPDVGGWILWMKLPETTKVRFHGKTNNVDLEYTWTLNELPKTELTSISTTETSQNADSTGAAATHWHLWTFNGGAATYDQVKDDMDVLVDNKDGKGFVKLLGNAASGFVWDTNFGIYTDGSGGFWFTGVDHSFTLRLQKKNDSSIYADADINFIPPHRDNYNLTPYEGTTATADANGALGIVLPKIGGTDVIKSDVDMFTYEVKVGDDWIPLNDIAASGFVYEGSGYNSASLSQQWGYFIDHVYGLWFQPVKQNTTLRIGYPKNGEKGGAIDGNYVTYTLIGNPDATGNLPDDMLTELTVDDETNSDGYTPAGWKMIWNDEFSGNALDTNKWNVIEGYLLEEDNIDTFGWGNQELEWYSKDNVKVENGLLNIHMKKDKKTFYAKGDTAHANGRTAEYSSGKITTQNNFSVKYGRVDVRAKFPSGNGIWPAVWMLPNDNLYGAWAYSGEIDIAEGRGRVPNKVFGAMHYGGAWPNNLNTSDLLDITADGKKKTDTTDWHVYSVVWENDNIKVYCDGKAFFKCTKDQWKSNSDMGNSYAPFDQRFYAIINLACGGTFDSGNKPGEDFIGADLYVDYIRAYQRMVGANDDEQPDHNAGMITDGADDNLYGDYKIGKKTTPVDPTTEAPTDETTKPVDPTKPADPTKSAETKAPTKKDNSKLINQVKSSKVTVKKAIKKKSAKKIKVTLKKTVAVADGYKVNVYKTKKNAKKNKKAIVKKTVKNKKKFKVSSKKIKKLKKIFIRVRAFKKIDGITFFGIWSKPKKVKIK